MMTRRDEFLNLIKQERERQFHLPGSEWDAKNNPNDWIAIASHYLTEEVRRGTNIPDRAAFEDALIKAAAVIMAALEHTETMQDKGSLR